MDRRVPLKPRPVAKEENRGGHGTAHAASRTGPLHPHALVVSLHDVSPKTRTACETILAELAALGLHHCSLLVVPDHHGAGNFLEDKGFCEWLQKQSQAGHEIVIHGYYHLRSRRTMEGLRTIFATRVYTADEGEFYDLDKAMALKLVTRAQEEFAQIGLKPDGFIAPAWMLGPEAAEAIKEHGCEYTTHLGDIEDLRSGKKYNSQSLVWSVRSLWRRVVSLGWNAFLYRFLSSNPLLRISIHPVDLKYVVVWRQIRGLIALAIKDRAQFTYERWITRERTFGAR